MIAGQTWNTADERVQNKERSRGATKARRNGDELKRPVVDLLQSRSLKNEFAWVDKENQDKVKKKKGAERGRTFFVSLSSLICPKVVPADTPLAASAGEICDGVQARQKLSIFLGACLGVEDAEEQIRLPISTRKCLGDELILLSSPWFS